ncbi:MDR family MFS transporter [Leifsonia sp. NPDC058292]|uniref:MDR family MFS transporter n=1 Tax=Leifsonia sp. NPDC058292 TaxID=3346428 RepID=UPI0036DE0DC1
MSDTGSTVNTSSTTLTDHSARNRLVISLLLVSAFVVILNETIMNVALPELMKDLGIAPSVGQWLTTAFMLTMAVVIPITGFLLQRLNTRTVFITAMGLFSLGTAISAAAPGFGMLVTGRVVQASGTAIMMPLLMTTVMTLVPASSRGKTMGNISIVMSVAPAIGPTVAGAILTFAGWRWMFLLVLPIALGALLLGAARIPNVTEPKKVPIDALSVVLSAIAFSGLIYGFSSIAEAAQGHQGLPVWVPLSAGAVALVGFVWRQLVLQRADRALLDLRVFRTRNFTVTTLMMAVAMASMFGTLILLPLYMQTVLRLEPLATGLVLLPGSLLMGLMGPIVGRIYDKRGPTPLIIPGTVLVSAMLWMLTTVDHTTPVAVLVLLHVGLSLGLSLTFTPLFTAGLGSLPPALYSHGSAVIGTNQQLSGAIGTALFITVLSTVGAHVAGDGGSAAQGVEAGVRAAFQTGAVISVLLVVGAFFVRRSTEPETVS